MSETGSCQNETTTSEDSLMDSVVAASIEDRDELNTPSILCGLKGLKQKKEGSVKSIFSFKPDASRSPSCFSSPRIPYQTAANRFNQQGTSASQTTKQDTCSEPASPSLLPQTDQWKDTFSIIPPVLKGKTHMQPVESQSQSLLPQTAEPKTDARTDSITVQPSGTQSLESSSATASQDKPGTQAGKKKKKIKEKCLGSSSATASPNRSVEETNKPVVQSGKKKQKQKIKDESQGSTSVAASPEETRETTNLNKPVTQPSKTKKKQKMKDKNAAVINASPRLELAGKTPHEKLPLEKTSNERPDTLLIPTQSSTRSTTEVSDLTEKINQRIETQLAELEHAPRKKMLVIETAVLHCVTSVQENIEKKLGKLKYSYNSENADILRKLLQTLKSTLGRLIEHQRKEREQFAGVTQASLSQLSQVEAVIQTNQLVELGKRQKAVVVLLAKQKDLASKLKEIEGERETKITDTERKGTKTKEEACSRDSMRNEDNIDLIAKNVPGRKNKVAGRNNSKVVQKAKDGNMPENLRKVAEMSALCTDELPKKKQNKNSRKFTEVYDDKVCDSTEDKISFSDNSSSVLDHDSQKLGSGLMDILKVLRNKKQEETISDLANSVHELATGSNSVASSMGAMIDQDSCRDDNTVDFDSEVENFMDKIKEASCNSENSGLDANNNSEVEIHENQIKEIKKKMFVGWNKEVQLLNEKNEDFIVDKNDENGPMDVTNTVSNMNKTDGLSFEKIWKSCGVKEHKGPKGLARNDRTLQNQGKDRFIRENDDEMSQMEDNDNIVHSSDKIELCIAEKKKMAQAKNKTGNQDKFITKENIRDQKEYSKDLEISENVINIISENKNSAKEKLEKGNKDLSDSLKSGKPALDNSSNSPVLMDALVKTRALVTVKPVTQYVPSDQSNKTGKRSLSDYDPSSGGIDPRTVYGHSKSPSPKTVADNANDDSPPKAIQPKLFYKHKIASRTNREETVVLDVVGCVADGHQDEGMLSQDVTTIPDTQETSTQETSARESPVKSTQSSKKTGRKRKQSSSSDEKIPSRKKYTKTSEEVSQRTGEYEGTTIQARNHKYKGTTIQAEAISEVTETDKTKNKVADDYNETVNMFNQQGVVNVLLKKNNHEKDKAKAIFANDYNEPVNMFSQGLVDNVLSKKNHEVIDTEINFDVVRQNELAQRTVATDDKTKGIPPPDEKLKETSTKSERLWTEMMKATDKHKTSVNDAKVTKSLFDKQPGPVPLKSPGEKLDKVIKRIREEKENKVSGIGKDGPSGMKNIDSGFKMPGVNKSLNEKTLEVPSQKNRITNVEKVDVNYNSLQQAGLAVGLALPLDKTMAPKQLTPNAAPLSAKNVNALMFSPPRQITDETYTDVSPTATSMSSDVFLVKAKELDRRMKLRAEMSQRIASQTENQRTNEKSENHGKAVGKSSDMYVGHKITASRTNETNRNIKMDLSQPMKAQVIGQSKGIWGDILPKQALDIDVEINDVNQSWATDAGMEQTVKTKTSAEKIEAVIDGVIKSAAAFGNEKKSSENKKAETVISNLTVPQTATNQVTYVADKTNIPLSQIPGRQMVLLKSQGQDFAQPQGQNFVQSLQVVPIKVIQSGSALANTAKVAGLSNSQVVIQNSLVSKSLETQVNTTQNQTITASLTPQGMIRSRRGEIFRTPMQWIMSLELERGVIKRRKAYEMITYNRQPLLTYCSYTNNFKQRTLEQTRTSQDSTDLKGTSNWEDSDEGHLHKFLSTCRIRLLSKEDLVPCDDLPDNFWANDFADVKVPSDIWECVNIWD